jgi:muconate cycloisomerase
MIIRKVDIWRLNLKFRYPFKHKLATHQASENLVVRVTTEEGVAGFGEGIPRAFVTGETLSGSLAYLQDVLGPAVLEGPPASPHTLPALLWEWYDRFSAATYPGAFCALETALLDAAGRTWNRPVADFLGPRQAAQVTYSAVLPLSPGPQLSQFLKLVRAQGMGFIKLKVGEDHDLETLALARQELGEEVDLRVDANGAWTPAEAISRIREMRPFRLTAVEQPVAKEDFEGMRQVREAVDVPLMADESLCTLADARRLIALKACQMFNLRLSKCGGLTATARLHQLAAAAGIRCQLGCHVGETSILAAAGRHFALTTPDLAYLEGSFAPFLLTRDPVADPVVFGPGGLALPLVGPGLGVRVLEETLDELAVARSTLS